MDQAELLAEFNSHLEKLDQYQSFIDKARDMSGKFSSAVVEKVVSDNTAKIQEVHAAVEPLLSQMKDAVASIEAEKAEVASGVEDARLRLEELELRKMIGEIDDEQFDEQSAAAREEVEGVDGRIASLDEQLASFHGALEAWGAHAPAAEPEEEAPLDLGPMFDDEEDDLLGSLEDEDDAFLGEAFGDEDAFAGEQGRGSHVHAERVSVSDDVSSVFEDEAAEEPIAAGDDDLAMGDDLMPLEEVAPDDSAGDPALASLLLAEGTPEEKVFAFDGEVISLGRNRDNTIQVKNDSKVSRYHCKVYRRDGYYFIEDNKSANGTLVDGQLVTEKRLFGGEEIIVGETMFRFRVQG